MKRRHGYLALAAGFLALCLASGEVTAQMSRARQRLAQTGPFDCFDRCFAEFKTCLGTPRDGGGSPVIIPPDGRDGTVRTPPPFDLCMRARAECDAACVPPATR